MSIFLLSFVVLAVITLLAMRRAPLVSWAGTLAAIVLVWSIGIFHGTLHFPWINFWVVLGLIPSAVLLALSHAGLRQKYVTGPAYKKIRDVLPTVSDTEQQALDAGTIGFDAEIFSGNPDWDKLRAVPPIILSQEEDAFLNGPVNELCAMIDDWQVRHVRNDIPEEIWDFVKRHGFLGMLISKEHGGLGFSAQAQSLILGKISSRSADVATIVMVPNSLGPGELIEKYGTDAQKDYYLPRLAKGDEVPCFGLTGPTSGSDAATMRDIGVVERGTFEGKEVLGIRLSWEKRYITLGPKATVLGLAFQLFDPSNLLGKGDELGITVAIIPTRHPGVEIGRRHLPCGAAFPNGPNWGKDVFIPMDWVIGGQEMAGEGWRMLMECLSAGRSISLPSSATAGAKAMVRFSTAYGRVLNHFGLPVSKMEGLEEPLARMVETAYVTEAARAATAAMVSRGERPSVISALMKYQMTERLRQSVNDAMDLHGGRGICDGPSNYLQSAYQMVPVGITVEGANILTRSLITFAQGVVRSHPYLYDEIRSVQASDPEDGLQAFDKAFTGHVGFIVSNVFGAFFHNITWGVFAHVPARDGGLPHYYKQLSRSSRNFALIADMTVSLLGGRMKVKQKLTGRLSDALSELYIGGCVLKRFEDDGRQADDKPILEMAMQNVLFRCQEALSGTIDNFPIVPVRVLLRVLVFPFGKPYRPARDDLAQKAVRAVAIPGAARDRLTRYMFVSDNPDDPTGLLEITFLKAVAAEEVEKKLDRAVRKGLVQRYHGVDWFAEAVAKKVLTEEEAAQLRELEDLTGRVIAVDHFDPAEVLPNYGAVGHNSARVL